MGFFFKSRKQQEAEFLAPQYLKHIRETTDILNSTTNPDTFFFRYDFLFERINQLVELEKYLSFKGDVPSVILAKLNNNMNSDINDFINRYYNDTLQQIDKLKTSKAKQKRITNFKQSLAIYLDKMDSENIKKIEDLFVKLQDQVILNSDNVTTLPATTETCMVENKKEPINSDGFEWYIMVSFGKSTSSSYNKAVYLAKDSPKYDEILDEKGNVTHTATFTHSKQDFLDFIVLYELVSSWKSAFFIINGEIIDKKTVGKIKYCYGDKCRTVKSDFCFGASHLTSNPFGCHRLQISAFNNPWHSYYVLKNNHYELNRDAIVERIRLTAETYKYCPAFNVKRILNVANKFPSTISIAEYNKIHNDNMRLRLT